MTASQEAELSRLVNYSNLPKSFGINDTAFRHRVSLPFSGSQRCSLSDGLNFGVPSSMDIL